MRLLLAIFLPPVLFFTIGKPIEGIICLILMVTLIGWIPAIIWAVYSLSEYNQDQRFAQLAKMQTQNRYFSEDSFNGKDVF
ncbi:conserved hypothetical protein [Taylorella equigenitalis 14/56]|uniref:YqaE/Pmp3 family membrane protein n=2 Tax=Taylorella equigenitalis TaxID=29575 RepID=I7IZT9_9BURK|nr:putative membrane protein [Taylorella equigenitalis MCE9]ASY40331.1 YqaE/Pmp3 family membrane protein [Taylorella equigenitalis]CCG18533.1 conserved hypothetical protein [Taylorella equigenitalis 14/56]WDU46628.1 YqaE/Pmp3 family membrane protein [Taylorella equigenitalis]WDU53605.1 YqaE/Pmp3 family membrane protein [Taylorella equigenitalis]